MSSRKVYFISSLSQSCWKTTDFLKLNFPTRYSYVGVPSAVEVLVALRVYHIALVLVDAEVEVHVVNHDVLVDSGYQHVALTVDAVLRYDEEPVVFPSVEAAERARGEAAGPAAAEYLPLFRIFYVY